MTVSAKLLDRDTYEVAYKQGAGPGPVTAVLTNPDTGDVSNYQGPDDGKFLVTTARGYTGSADVVVRKSEVAAKAEPKIKVEVDLSGRELDTGTIEFTGDAEVDNELPPPEGEIDNGLPAGPVFPNNDLPWAPAYPDVDPPLSGARPDHDLPWAPVRPDHDLPWAPAYPGNELPPDAGTSPDNTLPETPEPKA